MPTPPRNSDKPATTVHSAEPVQLWTLQIEASPEALLLPRILQKLAVPEVNLRRAHYEQGSTSAQVEIVVLATGAWVRLLAEKLRRLVHVRAVVVRLA